MRRALGLMLVLLAGCDQQPDPLYLPEGEAYPEKLSGWGMVQRANGHLQPAAEALAYDLNTPLFSDYTHKLRTVWLPPGQAARYGAERFDFPVGTVLTKTFYYPKDGQGRLLKTSRDERDPAQALALAKVKLMETRVLLRQRQGWVALPYVWDDAQQDATLEWAGASAALELHDEHGGTLAVDYQVPDANQCAGCHEERHGEGVQPLGPKARHLNRDLAYPEGVENQLQRWQRRGLLQGLPAHENIPRNAQASAPRLGESLEQQARSYLDINCAHCHNPKGPARTSGLYLDAATPLGIPYGLCKQPVAAGKGSGNRLVDIHPGQPDASVLIYRVESTDPSVMMPEIGRSTAHREGLELLTRWIAGLPRGC
ncbi:SO2930 family diheme c-type cytochrome [Metapseudomonas resinovorans]|uniref:SO2930 family diheme c-type cytochrome n=1 Tax=Metapseudomonas resinovorans TaxID=53412 RepID=UPI0003FF68EE|nr:SO2930 family diheme c-type cytochrome [Pseudomonas resinovorans]